MTDSNIWYLENIDLTKLLCPIKLDKYGSSHPYETVKKGDYIYLPNEESKKIYFIAEGKVKIGASGEGGREITKIILGKGEVFGEFAILGEESKKDFAQAMEETKLCVSDQDGIRNLMRDHNQLSLYFLNMLGSRLLKMEKRLESLVFKDSRSRIIEFILEQVETNGVRVGYEWVVRPNLTHQDIANLTATSRQTVTTVFNELKQNKLVHFNRRRWLVRDREELSKLAPGYKTN